VPVRVRPSAPILSPYIQRLIAPSRSMQCVRSCLSKLRDNRERAMGLLSAVTEIVRDLLIFVVAMTALLIVLIVVVSRMPDDNPLKRILTALSYRVGAAAAAGRCCHSHRAYSGHRRALRHRDSGCADLVLVHVLQGCYSLGVKATSTAAASEADHARLKRDEAGRIDLLIARSDRNGAIQNLPPHEVRGGGPPAGRSRACSEKAGAYPCRRAFARHLPRERGEERISHLAHPSRRLTGTTTGRCTSLGVRRPAR
jgi:hypothetical protein